jgi:hypothetical protein
MWRSCYVRAALEKILNAILGKEAYAEVDRRAGNGGEDDFGWLADGKA